MQVPLLASSMLNSELPDFHSGPEQVEVSPSHHSSFSCAVACWNVLQNPCRRLPEFHVRSHPVKSFSEFSFGDELVTLEFTAQVNSMSTPPLDNEALVGVGHKFSTQDQDDLDYWKELCIFFETGEYPCHLVTEREMLRFHKRSRQFFLQDNRLWLAPKISSDKLPRLVIESAPKHMDLMATAHNECGHRGRDATYQHLLDRFYWPNMYDDVTYFVRSCIECQKSVKSIPLLPYNESWQAPLL